MDLVGAQAGGAIGGEVGIPSAASEDDDAPLFQMANGPSPNEGLGDGYSSVSIDDVKADIVPFVGAIIGIVTSIG